MKENEALLSKGVKDERRKSKQKIKIFSLMWLSLSFSDMWLFHRYQESKGLLEDWDFELEIIVVEGSESCRKFLLGQRGHTDFGEVLNLKVVNFIQVFEEFSDEGSYFAVVMMLQGLEFRHWRQLIKQFTMSAYKEIYFLVRLTIKERAQKANYPV